MACGRYGWYAWIVGMAICWAGTDGIAFAETSVSDEYDVALRSERSAVEAGLELEVRRQWGEAIDFYGKAVEEYPENTRLEYGLRRSKIHFGIERRYADESFDQDLLGKSPSEALGVFDDLLSQIRSNYVDNISHTSFVAHGTESLYLALANQKFLSRHLPATKTEQLRSLRTTLRDRYWNRPVKDGRASRALVVEVCRLSRQIADLDETAVVMEYVFGGCNALDDYSNYLTPDRLDDLYGNIEGEFVGLGIEMKGEAGEGMLLVDVIGGSPAEAGGMLEGEHIVEIDGADCRDMSTDEAARLLRGPSGSQVELGLEDRFGRVRRSTFSRRAVQVKSIPVAEMIDADNGIGYIELSGFQKTTAQELDAALAKLKSQGMRRLVLDLRGNPGGLLTAAVDVLDRFIDDGVLVSTKGRSFDQNWKHSAHRSGTHRDLEIALIVDENSASASEIVAGAVRDYGRGVIVGRKTYGKWSVQSILPMRGRTGLRITTAKFYSPNGHTLGKIGLKPDITVEEDETYDVAYRGFKTRPADHPDVKAATDALLGGAFARR
ncbi:S41 family peptidase [Stratiformator vulcanicus]|uniref:Putative CtpA-like serine protease n=1 Tax=Stratiformator vulcanicus TaxID=2527980 RepID=A0A517QYC7_9PLAN|nr:S41 family peptidase [Stratiformator vulcanicus]QDT36603.1 putative CtpA-like serine protease [Stratiformator vulcanicus]